MDVEDLLARVQLRGRFHGRNESRRAICAVVEALGEFLSARAFHLIAEVLPDEARRVLRRPAPAGVPAPAPTCRSFLAAVATRLLTEGPDTAFTARVVLEELNTTGRVITPARFAHLVAADLRPLLCARPAPITADANNPAPRRLIRVSPAPARPAHAAPAHAAAARLAPAHAAPAHAAPAHQAVGHPAAASVAASVPAPVVGAAAAAAAAVALPVTQHPGSVTLAPAPTGVLPTAVEATVAAP